MKNRVLSTLLLAFVVLASVAMFTERTHIVGAYALGKAQRVMAELVRALLPPEAAADVDWSTLTRIDGTFVDQTPTAEAWAATNFRNVRIRRNRDTARSHVGLIRVPAPPAVPEDPARSTPAT